MIALLFASLALQGPSAAASAPRLVLEDLDGRRTEIPAAGLALKDPRERGAWIVRPVGFPPPAAQEKPAGDRAELSLVNGDELRGHVRGGTGETLELELAGAVSVPCTLSDLASLRLPEHIPAEERGALAAAAEGDRLYRNTGTTLDAIDGTVEGFTAEGVRFQSVLGSRVFPWHEIAALFVAALEKPAARGAGGLVPVSVDLLAEKQGDEAGSRLRAELVALEPERCRLRLGGKHELALPLGAVAEILVADGRLTYLSELAPAEESGRGAPFGDDLGMTWPARMDRNAVGGPLRAGGALYRRGLGMHAPDKLRFALHQDYARLRGSVAIDDSVLANGAAARGSVVFRLRADGELLWESPLVHGGSAPLALPALALAGKKTLELEVDPSGDFAGDRADWLDLALVR